MVAFAFAGGGGGMRHRPPAICDVAMYACTWGGEGKGGRDVAYLNSRSGRVISQNVNIFAGAEQAD